MEEQDIMREHAQILTDRGYRHQKQGQLGDAIALYRRSLSVYPTAEAHTHLGRAYSQMGRYDEAIAECEAAIELDPEYGNPYNDIGAYLIDMGQPEDAIIWLERAMYAERYDTPQLPYSNMGRVFEKLGRPYEALAAYDQALAIAPTYLPAHWAKTLLLGRLN